MHYVLPYRGILFVMLYLFRLYTHTHTHMILNFSLRFHIRMARRNYEQITLKESLLFLICPESLPSLCCAKNINIKIYRNIILPFVLDEGEAEGVPEKGGEEDWRKTAK